MTLSRAIVAVAGLLLAVGTMLLLNVVEGTPAPQKAPAVAPRPSKW